MFFERFYPKYIIFNVSYHIWMPFLVYLSYKNHLILTIFNIMFISKLAYIICSQKYFLGVENYEVRDRM